MEKKNPAKPQPTWFYYTVNSAWDGIATSWGTPSYKYVHTIQLHPSNTFNYHPKYTNKTILHISRTHLRTHYLSYTLNAHTTATSNQNTNTNYFILSRSLQTKVCSSQIFIYHTYNYIYIQNKSFNTNIYNQQTTHMFTMNILWTHRLSKTNYTVVSWATPHKKKKKYPNVITQT